jgi:hypothetical protein
MASDKHSQNRSDAQLDMQYVRGRINYHDPRPGWAASASKQSLQVWYSVVILISLLGCDEAEVVAREANSTQGFQEFLRSQNTFPYGFVLSRPFVIDAVAGRGGCLLSSIRGSSLPPAISISEGRIGFSTIRPRGAPIVRIPSAVPPRSTERSVLLRSGLWLRPRVSLQADFPALWPLSQAQCRRCDN